MSIISLRVIQYHTSKAHGATNMVPCDFLQSFGHEEAEKKSRRARSTAHRLHCSFHLSEARIILAVRFEKKNQADSSMMCAYLDDTYIFIWVFATLSFSSWRLNTKSRHLFLILNHSTRSFLAPIIFRLMSECPKGGIFGLRSWWWYHN